MRELARHGRIGIVWLDAHGDLNTTESSPSGNEWGMPLRMLIDAGANWHARHKSGLTPADLARRTPELAPLLRASG